MTSAVAQRRTGSYIERPAPSSLADVVELILDKGLVIDAYVRVSLVGIELLTVDARIVVASIDTYLRFAEATDRLNLYEKGGKSLDEMTESMQEKGAQGKTKGATRGALDSAKEKVNEFVSDSDDEDEGGDEDRGRGDGARRRPRSRQSASRRRSRNDQDEDDE